MSSRGAWGILFSVALFLPTSGHSAELSCNDVLAKLYPKNDERVLAWTQARTFESREKGTENQALVLSPQGERHFVRQVETLQRFWNHANRNLLENDFTLRRMILREMLDNASILLSGPPGSAKTLTGKLFTRMPFERPYGDIIDSFEITLSQLTPDSAIRGYVDYKQLKVDMESLGVKKVNLAAIVNSGAMVNFRKALLDEFDKMSPITAPAILDILAERSARYGPVVTKVRTGGIIATSNQMDYEMLASARAQDMERTYEALLDRILFKVFMHNTAIDPQNAIALLQLGDEKALNRAIEAGENAYALLERDLPLEHFVEERKPSFDAIDFEYLGHLANVSIRLTPYAEGLIQKLAYYMLNFFNQQKTESAERAAKQVNPSAYPVFYPPSILSNRMFVEYLSRVVKQSMFLDFMLAAGQQSTSGGSKRVTPETLAKLIQSKGGILAGASSAYRIHEAILTAAIGDPVLQVSQTPSQRVELELRWGSAIDELIRNAPDEGRRIALTNIVNARVAFARFFSDELKNTQERLNGISEGLSLLGIKPTRSNGFEGFEEALIEIYPRKPIDESGSHSNP